MINTYVVCTVVRVIDGDTVIMDVDLGFAVFTRQSFRLLGLNAREHDMPGGPEATIHLDAVLPVGAVVTLSSTKPDKFGGRYDATITLTDGTNLNQSLIQRQWAAAWNGEGTKPVPPWPRTVS